MGIDPHLRSYFHRAGRMMINNQVWGYVRSSKNLRLFKVRPGGCNLSFSTEVSQGFGVSRLHGHHPMVFECLFEYLNSAGEKSMFHGNISIFHG
jgi:hypothetical protein